MTNRQRTLAGKVALVVGAGPGIGRSCALALAADGAHVAVAARRAEPLLALADEVSQTYPRAIAIPADIADPDQCRDAVEQTVAQLGRIDVVVNVATYGGGSTPIADIDWTDYLEAVQVNIIGTMEICRTAAPHMTGGGAIVNISTLGTRSLLANHGRYTSTKAAMESLTKTMARELGPLGITANIVSPGFTSGPKLDGYFESVAEAEATTSAVVSERLARQAALRRHVDPTDIAEAVVFLASPRARNITGQNIQVSAGANID